MSQRVYLSSALIFARESLGGATHRAARDDCNGELVVPVTVSAPTRGYTGSPPVAGGKGCARSCATARHCRPRRANRAGQSARRPRSPPRRCRSLRRRWRCAARADVPTIPARRAPSPRRGRRTPRRRFPRPPAASRPSSNPATGPRGDGTSRARDPDTARLWVGGLRLEDDAVGVQAEPGFLRPIEHALRPRGPPDVGAVQKLGIGPTNSQRICNARLVGMGMPRYPRTCASLLQPSSVLQARLQPTHRAGSPCRVDQEDWLLPRTSRHRRSPSGERDGHLD